MKKVSFILLLSLIGIVSNKIFAKGGEQYAQAMQMAVKALDTAISPNEYLQLANNFERIGGVETTEWLPSYYAAYCYTMVVFIDHHKNTVDEYLDKAESFINKADAIKPNNSEIITVKGLINSARIMKDPASRGKKYGTIANEFYAQAIKIDDTNPRPYSLQGQGFFYTPKMFGGGKDKAKPLFETAISKYKTFKPESDIAPHWGLNMTNEMLKQCD